MSPQTADQALAIALVVPAIIVTLGLIVGGIAKDISDARRYRREAASRSPQPGPIPSGPHAGAAAMDKIRERLS